MNIIKQNQAQEEVDTSYDTSDNEAVNKVRKRAARTRADRLKFVEAAMSMEQGRAWFYDLLLRCKVISTPFSVDPYETAFRCGTQNVGLQVLDDIQTAAPEQYALMMSENKSRHG